MYVNRRLIVFIVWLIIITFIVSTLYSMVVYSDTEEGWSVITISAAGDVTLGRDALASYKGSFDHEVEVQNRDYSYFMRNVKPIFENDDLTIVNLEGPLTDYTLMADKQFRFKGSPAYTEILKQGSIEAVNLANNHIYDYLEKGYWDTVSALSAADIAYFGLEHKYLTEIKGIKVGLLGFTGWNNGSQIKKEIKAAVEEMKNKGANLIIVSFHWGEEKKYTPNNIQRDLGRYCIDIGADLVLGHHPHVIQGIETYKGKNIVYSLGNFCFGGNRNPSDKDAYIYQHSFYFKDGVLQMSAGQVIPVSVSSVKDRNNYQPTPLKGAEAARVMDKIKKYSLELNN